MDKYQNIKSKLFKEQDGKCFYCGEEFSIEQLDIEHLMPRSLTNDNSLRNKVLICRMCNIKKAGRLPFQEQEFSEFIYSLLDKHPDFRNVNQDVLIDTSKQYRGDIIVERNIKGKWVETLIEIKAFPTFTDKRLKDIISQLSTYKKILIKT